VELCFQMHLMAFKIEIVPSGWCRSYAILFFGCRICFFQRNRLHYLRRANSTLGSFVFFMLLRIGPFSDNLLWSLFCVAKNRLTCNCRLHGYYVWMVRRIWAIARVFVPLKPLIFPRPGREVRWQLICFYYFISKVISPFRKLRIRYKKKLAC